MSKFVFIFVTTKDVILHNVEPMKKLVFLTGAGMSVESGLSTFRDAGGLWDNYPVQQVASIEGYEANPKLVIDFYNGLRRKLWDVQPNEGHRIIADLEKHFEVTVVTQNVDNLHERAGSSHVIHLHGELTKVTSTYQPNNKKFIKELTPDNSDIHVGDKAADGSQLRPFIVWFGEQVPEIERAAEEVRDADIFVIVGTSMVVYPAAGLLGYTSAGIPIYLIDPAEVRMNSWYKVDHIQEGASRGMALLRDKLLEKES